MRLAWWMLLHEIRIQMRSNRFRVLLLLYLPLALAAPVAVYMTESDFVRRPGPGFWGAVIEAGLPLFTTLLAWVLAGDAILREQDENSFLVASLGVSSNSAYLASRWFAVSVIVTSISFVPLVVTMILAAQGNGAAAAKFAFVQWLVVVVPLVLMTTALSIGVSTTVGSAVGATIFVVIGGGFVLAVAQALLARIGRTIYGPLEWLRFERPFEFLQRMLDRWSERRVMYTDTPFDWRIHFEQALPRGVVILSISLFALVGATAFLRRTRPNHRVWRIGDSNPVRTYLKALRSLYERLTPDAGLGRGEKAAVVAAAILVAASFTAVFRMDEHWRDRARQRADIARSDWPEPTSVSFAVERVLVEGSVDPVSGIDLDVVLSMVNEGAEPVSHVSAELNPELRITPSGSTTDLTVEKRWDRVEVRLARPVSPGEKRDLALHVSGLPAENRFEGFDGDDFPGWFNRVTQARVEMYIPDFSRSIRERLVSRSRVDLNGAALVPVPRVMPWKGDDKTVRIVDISVDLTASDGLALASSCGELSREDGGLERLQSHCRGELRAFSVVGGRWSRGELSDHVNLAAIPLHLEQGERKARVLAEALDEAARRWPDLARAGSTVIAEVPNAQRFEAGEWIRGRRGESDEPTIEGSMVRVSEDWVMSRKDVAGLQMLIALRAQSLLARRPVIPWQSKFFRHFYGTLAAAELGHTRENGAVLGQTEHIQHGLFIDTPWEPVWTIRLPAVVNALRNRVGARTLYDGVEEFVSRDDPNPAGAQELLEILERRSGVPLERFFRDYVVNDYLPKLQLADVTFVRQRGGWVVDGSIRHEGKGQSVCEVVLRTEVATLTTVVTSDVDEPGSFHFESPHRPVKVELDPDRRCFRWEPRAAVREVLNEGGGS